MAISAGFLGQVGWYCEELGAMLAGTLQLGIQAAKLPGTNSLCRQ